jgi:3-isopropylmalate dehydrogenase
LPTYRLGVLRGDGIGPEIVDATLHVLGAAEQRQPHPDFEWVPLPVGWEAIRATGSAMPEATVTALEGCDAWLLGPDDSASYPESERAKLNPSGELRRRFDL